MGISLDSITRRQVRQLERELGATFSRTQALKTGASDVDLSRLVRRGYLARLGRGLYSVVELPTRRSEEPLLAATAHLSGEPNFVSWWVALAHHGLTEQVPFSAAIAVRRAHRDREAGGLRVHHVVLDERKFYGFGPTSRKKGSVSIATPEKAILDSMDCPDLAGGLREVVKALGWTSAYNPARLVELATRYPVRATKRRLGYLIETLDLGDASALASLVSPGGPLTALALDRARDGAQADRRWWVADNIGEDTLRRWARR